MDKKRLESALSAAIEAKVDDFAANIEPLAGADMATVAEIATERLRALIAGASRLTGGRAVVAGLFLNAISIRFDGGEK